MITFPTLVLAAICFSGFAAATESKFDYADPDRNWCSLENSKCCGSKSQSPINILTRDLLSQAEFNAKPKTEAPAAPASTQAVATEAAATEAAATEAAATEAVTEEEAEAAATEAAEEAVTEEEAEAAATEAAEEAPADRFMDTLDRFDMKAKYPIQWSGSYDDEQPSQLINEGHSIELNILSDSCLLSGGILGGDEYKLKKVHFHWGPYNRQGSEHFVDSVQFDGEVHLVHENIKDPNDLTVVAFFLMDNVVGNGSRWLDTIVSRGYDIKKVGSFVNIGHDLGELFLDIPAMTNYVYYKGSTTMPPCSENVNWIIMMDPVEIEDNQLNFFRDTLAIEGNCDMNMNFRPVQPTNGRDVFKSFETP